MGYQAHCVVMEEISKASGLDLVLKQAMADRSKSQAALGYHTRRTHSYASTNYASTAISNRKRGSFQA